MAFEAGDWPPAGFPHQLQCPLVWHELISGSDAHSPSKPKWPCVWQIRITFHSPIIPCREVGKDSDEEARGLESR